MARSGTGRRASDTWEGSDMTVVMITGASGGIGRATARRFAADGARIGLLARGEKGLAAAATEVRALGGEALILPCDASDFAAVDAAAGKLEAEFGPIDVWVNAAFVSVFAPFARIRPDEFRRVTEVTYLGAVHGTMAALARMRERDRGAIVQVGSALGERAIPLQSAYCGAKHAINGFTESLRVELLHDHSNVHITIVQAPAVNTPQFSWVRSRLPKRPQPVPPIYQPEIIADTIAFAATHPRRKQYWVGASTVGTVLAQRLAPPYWTATWPAPDTAPSKPISPPNPAPTTSGTPWTARTAPITAHTAISTPEHTAAAHRLGSLSGSNR
ncbi:SDR family NAD(P)-dependent oxidoreductase [Nocardia arthritidis]|uniref:SDR family NAD(P)-dependent oxidoreductase n=1 Tax=Nocardia arthritidis TaxID=228602 RepID=A0A6G9YMK7_9NOCA|nr:SDR family NAD(P)-dependent oxidoreductase [Nocardia arthritidis]